MPVSYLMTIVDEIVQEEGCGKTRKEGHEKRTLLERRWEGEKDRMEKEESHIQRQ